MGLKLIPQVSAYKVVLPPTADMWAHLVSLPHEELQASQMAGSGFVPVEPIGEMLHAFPGGYAFALQYDEKVIPGSVIKDELKKRSAIFKEREDYTPGRKEQREMRELITAELCAKALVRTKVVTCFYNTKDQYLILPTISRKLKDTIMSQLVRAVESIKSTTINVSTAKGSLTNRLENYMAFQNADAFGEFTIGDRVTLIGEQGKSTFDLLDLTYAMNGVREAIAAGGQVSEIALSLNGVSFRLTQDFLLKGVVFEDGAVEEHDAKDPDKVACFEHEASVKLLLVSKIIGELCRMFDYVPTIKDEGDDLA